MSHCPKHIEGSAKDVKHLFPGEADEYHHYFQVVCGCGSDLFYLFFGNKRSVHGICYKCLQDAVIYDLSKYPAATRPKGEETFQLKADLAKPLKVFVGYEYGQLDEDQEFDQNDITWCQVFVEVEGKRQKVFDDETA